MKRLVNDLLVNTLIILITSFIVKEGSGTFSWPTHRCQVCNQLCKVNTQGITGNVSVKKKPGFFGSHATSTTFLRPSLRNWCWKPFSEMLLLKLLLLLLLRYVLLQNCGNFITKCERYYQVQWLLQSAIEQTLKLKRSSRIGEQSGKNRWHRTLRPAKDWRGDTQ